MVVLDHLPIADLEGAIEFGEHDDRVREIVRKAISDRWGQTYDYVFLGCSHFPLVRGIIEEEVRAAFNRVGIIDPAEIAAEEAVREFDMVGSGNTHFKLSQDSEHFRRRVEDLFPESIRDFRII
jgi:glutamate racemase